MARIPRILITGDSTVYHIISRTALQGFPLEDIEKDFLVEQMKHASQLWFVDIMGFCCMGNHFHLLVRMLPDTDFSDADMLKRLAAYYGDDRIFFFFTVYLSLIKETISTNTFTVLRGYAYVARIPILS